MANSTVERPLLFFINQIRNFMNYFAKKENGRSTQDSVSNTERAMGHELELYLSQTFSHFPVGEKRGIDTGHSILGQQDHWSISKGDTEIQITRGTGVPRIRKVCNTLRSKKKRIEILKKFKTAILPEQWDGKEIRERKIA